MDFSPGKILEQLRSGQLPPELKMSLAKGLVPLDPVPLLDTLTTLGTDQDAAVRAEALKSLGRLPPSIINGVCDSRQVSPELLDRMARYFARREEPLEKILLNAAVAMETVAFIAGLPQRKLLDMIGRNQVRLESFPAIVEALRKNPETPVEIIHLWEERDERAKKAADASRLKKEEEKKKEEEFSKILTEEGDSGTDADGKVLAPEELVEKKKSIQQLLRDMTAGQKVALAMKGNGEVRKILIGDKNKAVCVKVLENPLITESEVEFYAKSSTVSDEILRIIGTNRDWIRKQPVVKALITNPKTPLAMSMRFLNRMSIRELEGLSRNRNIPEVLRNTAKKLFKAKKGM